MTPRPITIDSEELKKMIKDDVHDEFRAAFGPSYGSSQDDPNERVRDMFFLRTLRRKSEVVGGKIVAAFLAFVIAGLATLGFFGKLPFTGVGE